MRDASGKAAVTLYVFVFSASIFYLNYTGLYKFSDSAPFLAIIGVAFPALALLLTIGMKPYEGHISRATAEAGTVFALVGVISMYLVWGSALIAILFPDAAHGGSGIEHLAGTVLAKLIVFVAIPYAVLRFGFAHRWADFGLSRAKWTAIWGRDGIVVLGIGVAVCAFQLFSGPETVPLRNGTLSSVSLLVGMPLVFLWMMVEVGFVEEFFFRAVVQTRLAAYFKSNIAGLIGMALLFGLAHVPGMVIRGVGIEELPRQPDLLESLAYNFAIQSVSAFTFGIVWMRTRNLPALMLIHAAVDWFPTAPSMLRLFGLSH